MTHTDLLCSVALCTSLFEDFGTLSHIAIWNTHLFNTNTFNTNYVGKTDVVLYWKCIHPIRKGSGAVVWHRMWLTKHVPKEGGRVHLSYRNTLYSFHPRGGATITSKQTTLPRHEPVNKL